MFVNVLHINQSMSPNKYKYPSDEFVLYICINPSDRVVFAQIGGLFYGGSPEN